MWYTIVAGTTTVACSALLGNVGVTCSLHELTRHPSIIQGAAFKGAARVQTTSTSVVGGVKAPEDRLETCFQVSQQLLHLGVKVLQTWAEPTAKDGSGALSGPGNNIKPALTLSLTKPVR